MFESPGVASAVSAARDGLRAAVDGYLALDQNALSDDDVLALVRGFEVELSRAGAVRHRQVAEVEARGIARARCKTSTGVLLAQLLRITPGEGVRRVRAAANLGPRRGLTGELLEPLFAHVAAAQAAGLLSGEHAAVIITAYDALPHAVQVESGAEFEQDLVRHAQQLDPKQLAQAAARGRVRWSV
jgi:hypothetical protein